MTTLDLILTCVSGGILVIGTIISSLFGAGFKKEKKTSNNVLNYLNIVCDVLPEAMKKYEAIFQKGNGEQKQTLVLNEIQKYCVDNKIQYNEPLVLDAISKLIDISKNINKGK